MDVLIPKKEGEEFVEKLRPILMFEVDANNNNKILGGEMMHHTERAKSITKEQCGSRKGHSSEEQVLNKGLSFDLIQLN